MSTFSVRAAPRVSSTFLVLTVAACVVAAFIASRAAHGLFSPVTSGACLMTMSMHSYDPVPVRSRGATAGHPPHYRAFRCLDGQSPRGRSACGLADGGALAVVFIPGNGGDHKQARSLGSRLAQAEAAAETKAEAAASLHQAGLEAAELAAATEAAAELEGALALLHQDCGLEFERE
jgi:hypothetical protein